MVTAMSLLKQGREFGHMLAFSVLLVLVAGALGSGHVAPCPSGWTAFDKEIPTTCLQPQQNRKYWTAASTICANMSASLMRPDSEAKYEQFKALAESKREGLWLPLMKLPSGLHWQTKDGEVPVTSLPIHLQRLPVWYASDHSFNRRPIIYRHVNNLYRYDQITTWPYFVCEKRASCAKGWFGLGCDKECHCYSQECDPLDVEVTCHYGCELGWMGKDCSKPKEDADVRYFCVNSPDLGKYAHLRIDTKGVEYENIHAVNDEGEWTSWCNDTTTHTDHQLSIVTIKIYINHDTKQDILDQSCAGKITRSGNYEWRLKVQEKGGIVSRNDQEFHIECNFDDADSFQAHGETEIKRERGFKRSEVKRPIEFLDEMKETVTLALVDPFDGEEVSETHIGTSVVLKVTFAVEDGDVATGAIPYNCYASTPDHKTKAEFLDSNGCPKAGFPISAFYNNTSKSLITKPFNLFGFEGSEEVDFHCSYVLCFENEPCPAGCLVRSADFNQTSDRYRRSTAKTKGLKLMDVAGVKPARTPAMRRREEMLLQVEPQ